MAISPIHPHETNILSCVVLFAFPLTYVKPTSKHVKIFSFSSDVDPHLFQATLTWMASENDD